MALTYNGATAGTTLANPPICIEETWNGGVQNSPGLTGGKIWFYTSTNVASDLTSTGAIADGYAIGMRVGDVLIGVQSSAGSSSPIVYLGVVGTQSSGASAANNFASSGVSLSSNVLTSTAV